MNPITEKIKVAIVDDHIVVRSGLVYLIKDFQHLEIILEADGGKELYTELMQSKSLPDIVITDIEMPDFDGFDTAKLILKHFPQIKIIFLSSYNYETYVEKAIYVGASAFLSKGVSIEELIECIEQVYEKSIYFNQYVTEDKLMAVLQLKQNAKNVETDLSEKDIEFIKYVCKQFSDKDIADRMGISHNTAKTYRKQIMKKIGVNKTAGIIIYAYNNELHKD